MVNELIRHKVVFKRRVQPLCKCSVLAAVANEGPVIISRMRLGLRRLIGHMAGESVEEYAARESLLAPSILSSRRRSTHTFVRWLDSACKGGMKSLKVGREVFITRSSSVRATGVRRARCPFAF